MKHTLIDAPSNLNSVHRSEVTDADVLADDDADIFVFPTAVGQKGFWYLDRFDPGNPAYNIAVRFRLDGALNHDAMSRAINEIVRRHESLRTVVKELQGEPVQVVMPTVSIPLPVVDLRTIPASDRHPRSETLATEEARKRFDLSTGPLVRAALLWLEEQLHVLLVTVHHIISDGWSIGVFTRELGPLYDAYCRGLDSPLEDLSLQYGDFAVYQEHWLESGHLGGQLDYWKRKLSRLPSLEIPPDRPRRGFGAGNGHVESLVLSRILTNTLEAWSRGRGYTFFMLVVAALKVLISRETGRDDIFVGTLAAGRSRVELEPLIGLFINPLVLRTDLSGDPLFPGLLAQVSETILGALANQDVPFERVARAIRPGRGEHGREPVFRINFIYQRDFVKPLEAGGVELTAIPSRSPGAIYDLNFFLVERADGWRASCEYNTDLYNPATVIRLLARFRALLEGLAADPERRISQVPSESVVECEPGPLGAQPSHWLGPDGSTALVPGATTYVAPRNKIEARLAEMWETLLGVNRISVMADFFDEGGYSLLAAKLLSMIECTFGTRLSLAALLQSPTIRGLAAQLHSDKRLSLARQIYSIRSGTSWPPFVVQTNQPDAWRKLARHLNPDLPLHGILLPEMTALSVGTDLEALAANLVEALQEAVPKGPYYLGGWCRSGIIAYEMARQLRERGAEVALVVLIDSYSPPYRRSFRGLKALPIRLYLLAERHHYYHLARIREGRSINIASFMRRQMRAVSESVKTLLGSWWSRRHNGRSDNSPDELERFINLLADRYVPKPYDGQVVLFRTEKFQRGRFRDLKLGWGNLVLGGLHVYELPGYHAAVFQEPVVAMMARELALYLPSTADQENDRRRGVNSPASDH